MAKTYGDVVTLMRIIIGERDGNDPDATEAVLLGFVSDFASLVMGQDIKTHDLWSYFSFDTVVGQDTYAFKDQGFTNIYPVGTVTDSNNGDTYLRWFQDPSKFYIIHPVNNAAEQSGRPCDLLYYNDEIILRPKADAVYSIRLRGYKELAEVTDGTTNLPQNYYFYYMAYGPALDYLAAHGRFEEYAQIKPVFDRYRRLVLNRRAKQEVIERAPQAL